MPTLVAALLKTVGLAAVFVRLVAVVLGFRNEELIALLDYAGQPHDAQLLRHGEEYGP